MSVKIKLVSVKYSGDNIGDDIRFDIQVGDASFISDRHIKHGTTLTVDKEIARFETDGALEKDVYIKITEKDIIFSDTGETRGAIAFDPNNLSKNQVFPFEIKVQERGRKLRKKTAVFTVNLQADIGGRLRPYKSKRPEEDYNRFDSEIIKAVDFWNKEFAAQQSPPPVLLDPDLVKAMVYVESRMGYYRSRKKGAYPGYPDVMQVANPADQAIHVLRDDGKVGGEYEVVNGELKQLFYPEANAATPRDSIKWGVRWLYKKAQKNVQNDSGWHREWKPWSDAVLEYGPNTREYQNKVWKIYMEGFDQSGYQLWTILVPLLLVPALVFGMRTIQGKTYVTFENVAGRIAGMEDYQVTARVFNGLWFERVPLTITYGNAGNFLALDKEGPIKIDYPDIDGDGQKEIWISGGYLTNSVSYLLKKGGDGKFRVVPNIGEYGEKNQAFSSQKVELRRVGGDSNLEIVETVLVPYRNAPDQLWVSYYILDTDDSYKFSKKVKENCPCPEIAGEIISQNDFGLRN